MARNRYNTTSMVFSGPAFSFRGFRRDYDDDDDDGGGYSNHNNDNDNDNSGPEAAAAFFEACPPDGDAPAAGEDVDTRRDADSDEEAYSKGRKRRFHSSSSSSQSPYRSNKSSLSPQGSASYCQSSEDLEDEDEDEEDEKSGKDHHHNDDKDSRDHDHNNDDKTTRDHHHHHNDDKTRRDHHNDDKDRRHHNDDNDKTRSTASTASSGSSSKTVCRVINDQEVDEEEFYEEGWRELPVILLEDIFVLLNPKQRHQASMVCRPWYEIFYSPRVWETFVLLERTLTRRRFNLYKGYQRELCPRKTQLCLMRVGCFFKRIVVTPISDYYNLYEFLRVLAAYLVFYNDFPMPLLHTFRFTFACESRGVNGVAVIGTGGNILDKVKDLLRTMQQLRHLAVNQLLLDVEEVPGLLAAAARNCTDSLLSLELLNCSKIPIPICEVTQFVHLVKLKVSPQHLSEEVILLLGGTQLLQLHVVQDAYTCPCHPVPGEAWKLFKEMAPHKRVFLEMEGLTKTPLMLQPHAPVRGVVFRTPYHRLQPDLTTWLVEYYAKHLEYVVQETLPRNHGSRKFHERADASFLRLVRDCPKLHTLVIRERLSLATLLLLAKEGRALRCFIVRKNALIKKCEWPRAKNWTQDFHGWLRRHGRNYDLAFEQVPRLLGFKWKPYLDRTFKHIRLQIV